MKRLVAVVIAGLIAASAAPAEGKGFGVGAFAGLNIPVAQDDAEQGTVFGLRGRWTAIMSIAVEPQILLLRNGDWDAPIDEDAGLTETLKSWKATSFGVNVVLGAPAVQMSGFRPIFYGGLRLNFMDVPEQDGETKVGLGGGLGLELGFRQIGVDVRAGLEVFPGDDASRKNIIVTGGVNLYLGP